MNLRKEQLWKLGIIFLFISFYLYLSSEFILACSRVEPVSVESMCVGADVIVRAIALDYRQKPSEDTINIWAPDAVIRFKILEVLKGKNVPRDIFLNGFLDEKDDYNDQSLPYNFVRPGGRGGNCFAFTYKRQGQFLLFLSKDGEGFTLYMDPLAPVNEQLHSANDPWVLWIKDLLKKLEKQ